MIYLETVKDGKVELYGEEKPAEGSIVKVDPIECITKETYREFIDGCSFALIHFWASWDNTHLAVQQQLITALDGLESPVRSAMWDTDDPGSRSAMKQLDICTVPTLIYYKNGAVVFRQNGMRPVDQIRKTLETLVRP